MRNGLGILLLVVLVIFAPLRPAAAQDAPIQGVIQSQIDAFQADDFARAFSFASPTIQGMFGTPENFGLMVKEGYPMVYRPAEVEMQELREIAEMCIRDRAARDRGEPVAAGADHRSGRTRAFPGLHDDRDARGLADQRGPAVAGARYRGLSVARAARPARGGLRAG